MDSGLNTIGMNGKFYELIPITETGAATGPLITDMDDEKRMAVLDAIAKWEAKNGENPCV